ncbi:MAG: hypothetical protein JNK64_32865 [Myxococcales bacterium]|nr:hypothetical protein [Myxococcales bacterium]
MGAFSTLCAFDLARYRATVVPAVRTLLATGHRDAALAAGFDATLARHRRSEAAHADHYQRHPKLSLELEGLAAGLGIELAAVCAFLDDDLAVREAPPGGWLDVHARIDGACAAAGCAVRARCPMHRDQRGPAKAEQFGGLIKDAAFACCVDAPPVVELGRHATLASFSVWYGLERGVDPWGTEVLERAYRQGDDPLARLLVALSRRGAGWGWGDGGFGEGLLGWLAPEEAAALAAGLAAYDLTPTAAVPAGLSEHDAEVELPAARARMAKLRDMAAACAARGLGVLMRRD